MVVENPLRRVTLYTRPGCHLCEAALLILARLASEFPHEVRAVDISSDPALLERYGERIPVFVIGATEVAAPISEYRLRHALRQEVEGHANRPADPDPPGGIPGPDQPGRG